MKWDKAFETGHAVVDKEHQEIFALVQKVLDAAFTSRKEKIDTAINFLVGYTLEHFRHEERLMRESEYPLRAQHEAQHKAFAASVTELKKKIDASGDTIPISSEVNATVVDWLVDHVIGSDMKLAAHYKKWQKKH